MKHTFSLLVCLSVLLGLSTGKSAHGQSMLGPDRTILLEAPLRPAKQLDEAPAQTFWMWLARGKEERAQRCDRPAFQLRLGRFITITVPKS